MKPLPIEPKDEKKPCFIKPYNSLRSFTLSGLFNKIMKEAKQNNWKIVDYKSGLFGVTVTFQDRLE